MKKNILVLLILLCKITHGATEYLYPVGYYFDDEVLLVYLLYQKSPEHIELWSWNPTTSKARKALLSSYRPAGFQMMPDQTGFSFIDEDHIRIKYFDKRSPKTLAIYEPLYNFTTLHWITSSSFYFSAQEHQKFNLYHATTEGDVCCLITANDADLMYPQKIGGELFYIERDHNKHHKIMSADYPVIPTLNIDETDSLQTKQKIISIYEAQRDAFDGIPRNRHMVIDVGDQPIGFLTMISATQGFYCAYPHMIERSDKQIDFDYYCIKKTNNSWQTEWLFSYTIPTDFLLVHDTRVYESILPFLPHYADGLCYFFSSSDHQPLALYRYDIHNNTMDLLHQSTHHCFGLCAINTTLFFGGEVSENMMWIDSDGDICYSLSYI